MIPLFKVHMPGNVDKPLLDVLHSGYITQGPKVEEFEGRVADFLGTKNVISVNSGTSALALALRLAGVEPGDEVVTTPMTCSATNLPILQTGAVPVFADVDADSGMIAPASVNKLITKKTKAIMCVDWGGLQPDLNALMAIAVKHKIKLIQDAAHAFGARYNGRMVGTIAHFTCFSLQAIKHISTGDGGILTTREPYDAERGKRLRWFGIKRDLDSKDTRINEDITEWGYKFHMNDIAATIGIAQMDHIDKVLSQHRLNAAYYDKEICSCIGKPVNKFGGGAYWLYTLLLPDSRTRDRFKAYMESRGIQTSQVHRRNDEYSVFKKYAKGSRPGLDKFAERMVCIPVHHGIGPEQSAKIAGEVNKFAEKEKL